MGRNGSPPGVRNAGLRRPEPRPARLAVVGHANVDHLLEVAELPAADRTVPVVRHRVRFGGTAANLAVAARRLGLATSLITRIGADYPPAFLRSLRAVGVDVAGVERVRGVPTPACYIALDGKGGQATLIDQGPMATSGSVPVAVVRRAGWVHLSTGAPEYLLAIRAEAAAHRVPVSVDPAQEIHYRWNAASFAALLDGAEILFGNRAEIAAAQRLAGVASVSGLLERVPLVIETRGARGVRAFDRTGRTEVPAVRLGPVRDPTGAGDAFRAGFYAAWFAGRDLEGTLRAGSRAAAAWLRARRRPSGRDGLS